MTDYSPAFATVTYCGTPIHGYCWARWFDKYLQAPDGHTWDLLTEFPGASWPELGSTRVIKHPSAPGNQRTEPDQVTADAAQHYEWRDYALLSGKNHWIAGQELGNLTTIYVDDSGVPWLIEIIPSYDDVAKTLTIDIYNNGRFGYFGPEEYDNIHQQIGTHTWQPTLPAWKDGATLDDVAMVDFHSAANNYDVAIEHNQRGSNILWHSYTLGSYWGSYSFLDPFTLVDVLSIDISGSGDTAEGVSYGDGLSAAVSIYSNYNSLGYLNKSPITNKDYGVRFDYEVVSRVYGPCPYDSGHELEIARYYDYQCTNDNTEASQSLEAKYVVRYAYDGADQIIPIELFRDYHWTVTKYGSSSGGADYFEADIAPACYVAKYDPVTQNTHTLSAYITDQTVDKYAFFVDGVEVLSWSMTLDYTSDEVEEVYIGGTIDTFKIVSVPIGAQQWEVNGTPVPENHIFRGGAVYANSNNALAFVVTGAGPHPDPYYIHDFYLVTPSGQTALARHYESGWSVYSNLSYGDNNGHTWQPMTGEYAFAENKDHTFV